MAKQKLKTRDRVIAAARELFVAKGFEATSISEICQLSGISNGSVFHHFGTKDAILREVYLIERDAYWDYIFKPLEENDDPLDGLEGLVRACFSFERDHPDLFNFLIDAGNSPALTRGDISASILKNNYLVRAGKWAAPHVRNGLLPIANPYAFGALLFGPPSWIARLRRFDTRLADEDAMIDSLVLLIRKALAPDDTAQ